MRWLPRSAFTRPPRDPSGQRPGETGDLQQGGGTGEGGQGSQAGAQLSTGGSTGQPGSGAGSSQEHGTRRPRSPGGEREFISYVAVRSEDDEAHDPDGLEPTDRLWLEGLAVDLIRSREPQLEAMPAGNVGFDLVEKDGSGAPKRWVEVKAMMGSLNDRPVGLSPAQFDFAKEHGQQYWLYVVEHANDPSHARIVKIQDPAGRGSTFTFDRGWVEIAEIDDLLDKAS
jgi:hypothetical protein